MSSEVARAQAPPALFRSFSRLAESVPWMSLGRFPTRVERVDGLVSPKVELWVKRDDESGARYGGNKVRKLEFLLGEARAKGARRVATLGAVGSHHVLATAIYGRAAGFSVDAVVFPQPVTPHVREQILADLGSGARLLPARSLLTVPAKVHRLQRDEASYWIAPGGSSPTGTLGYVSAGLELLEQADAGLLPRPDVIVVALGSCGTAAGLLVGLGGAPSLPAFRGELVGVRVVDRIVCNAGAARRLAARTAALLTGRGEDWFNQSRAPKFRVEHEWFGGAYGRSTAASEAAVARAAAAGLRLETTYTGKAMAALLAAADRGALDGKRVLFVHTYNSVDVSALVGDAGGPERVPGGLRRYFPPMIAKEE